MLWNFITGEKLRECLYDLFSKYLLVNPEINLVTCNQQFFNGMKWNRLENIRYVAQARLSIWLQVKMCIYVCECVSVSVYYITS